MTACIHKVIWILLKRTLTSIPTTPAVHFNRHLMKCNTPSTGALSITQLTIMDTSITGCKNIVEMNSWILLFIEHRCPIKQKYNFSLHKVKSKFVWWRNWLDFLSLVFIISAFSIQIRLTDLDVHCHSTLYLSSYHRSNFNIYWKFSWQWPNFFFLAHHHMPITQTRVTLKIVSNWFSTGINQLEWMLPELPHCCVPAEN